MFIFSALQVIKLVRLVSLKYIQLIVIYECFEVFCFSNKFCLREKFAPD